MDQRGLKTLNLGEQTVKISNIHHQHPKTVQIKINAT